MRERERERKKERDRANANGVMKERGNAWRPLGRWELLYIKEARCTRWEHPCEVKAQKKGKRKKKR